MLIKPTEDLRWSDVTPKELYLRRREFIRAAGLGLLGSAAGLLSPAEARAQGKGAPLPNVKKTAWGEGEMRTAYEAVTTYNNFYELGVDKDGPSRNAASLKPRPWNVCVEGRSMVIPWVGFPLRDLLTQVEPTAKARFVEFTTLYAPNQLPGQQRPVLDWPYTEGLRLDEAMNPLTLLAVGLYGEVLPNQNGAPIRLVVPWKYGFKSIKSIVRIRLVDR